MPRGSLSRLRRLAALYGVQLAYRDVGGVRRVASAEALQAVLSALGISIGNGIDLDAALAEAEHAPWRRVLDPVAVAWQERTPILELRLAAADCEGLGEFVLEVEGGEPLRWTVNLSSVPDRGEATIAGARYLVKPIALPNGLVPGYHSLRFAWRGREATSTLMVASRHVYQGDGRQRQWGAFLPLYALRSEHSLGCGDLGDLEALLDWIRGLGGQLAGTLPLLAGFLDRPFEPSPYSPVSRLFWNELYIDVERIPELSGCPGARQRLSSGSFGEEMSRLAGAPLTDHRRTMALKRELLEELAGCLERAGGERLEAFNHWCQADPGRRSYARFRAAAERLDQPWPQWPRRLREGRLLPGDVDSKAERFHLYVQWVLDEQLARLSGGAGGGLYLDFPLGVHAHGYDTWHERESFALGARAGAPPDAFFAEGQDWAFPPLHPLRLREQAYRYQRASLRHHLERSGMLRIDHVMGMHRLYWIPEGMAKRDGVYVRYPAEEFYAVLSIESHRSGAVLVGEDLGLVPKYVRGAMKRHRLSGIYCLPWERAEDPSRPLRPVPMAALACLNTHDMAPFASYLAGLSRTEKETLAAYLCSLGFLERVPAESGDLLKGCLAYLAASPARAVVVNLEDLWFETQRQNLPGTSLNEPNWSRRASLGLEEMRRRPEVLDALACVQSWRRSG